MEALEKALAVAAAAIWEWGRGPDWRRVVRKVAARSAAVGWGG